MACNRLDAYFESGTKTWDRAAGTLIASEAGAQILMIEPDVPGTDPTALAAPPSLARDLLALITRAHRQADQPERSRPEPLVF